MKKILFILTIILASCTTECKSDKIVGFPGVSNCGTKNCDSLQLLLNACRTVLPKADTIRISVVDKHLVDSLKTELFIYKYKIERVRYHLNICLKNKSQDVFLKGWINRDIN